MVGKFNHHLFPTQKVVIKSAGHLSETFFNHHLLITMGPLPTSVAAFAGARHRVRYLSGSGWLGGGLGVCHLRQLLPSSCCPHSRGITRPEAAIRRRNIESVLVLGWYGHIIPP